MTTALLQGSVRDIDPNGPTPRWEIFFDAHMYAAQFPSEHESEIEIEWPSGVFCTMIGIKPRNPIYLRTAAVSLDGKVRTRVSDLCATHGLARSGPVTFEVVIPRRRFRVRVPVGGRIDALVA